MIAIMLTFNIFAYDCLEDNLLRYPHESGAQAAYTCDLELSGAEVDHNNTLLKSVQAAHESLKE